MVAGLIDRPLTYREYVYLPVHRDDSLVRKIEKKKEQMQSTEMIRAAKRSAKPPPDEEILWSEEVA